LIDFLPFKEGVNLYEAKYGEEATEVEDDLALREFVLFNAAGDATEEILSDPGRTYILVAARLDDIKPACAARFEKLIERAKAEGAKVVVATSSPLSDNETLAFGASAPVTVYNLDSGTMITMLRARTGVVVIENGVIADKRNCRDIK
jgi:Asp-tRNA(Asn)/Glu-tRNA(Gln) amidotransferase A subunit family amidase